MSYSNKAKEAEAEGLRAKKRKIEKDYTLVYGQINHDWDCLQANQVFKFFQSRQFHLLVFDF
jgi:hypothetical protein